MARAGICNQFSPESHRTAYAESLSVCASTCPLADIVCHPKDRRITTVEGKRGITTTVRTCLPSTRRIKAAIAEKKQKDDNGVE